MYHYFRKKIIDLGKRCLSNLRDFVNDEYCLGFNEVKRLRTLFFLVCQKVVGKQRKSKNHYLVNELWNEKLEEKFQEALMITKKSKVGNDESEVEEVFNTPVCDKYSRLEFSLEELDRIFYLIKDGLDRCKEINEDLYFEIEYFIKLYYVYIMFILLITRF